MKGKQLRKAVLLGMAMSMALWTTGMAKYPITGPITDGRYNRPEDNPYTESVTVTNNTATESTIQVNGETVNIATGSGGETGYDITLDSQGSGIRTEGGDNTSSVSLNSSANNIINFGNGGNGIFSESGMDITLDAGGNNEITTLYTDVGDGDGGDGINATNSGKITLTAGGSNIIKVISDGIYTEEGSSNDKELIAETGNNEIIANNNGIDHRGSGNINLKAENGSNFINAANGDGVRVNGTGTVTLNAQENTITAGDNGIQVSNGGQVTVMASGENGNHITAKNTGIYIEGKNSFVDISGQTTKIQAAASDSGDVFGIDMNGGALDLNTTENEKINIIAETTSGNATGIHMSTMQEYGEANLFNSTDIGTLTISALSQENGTAVGVNLEGNTKLNITADSLEISAKAQGTSVTSAVGIQTSVNADLGIETQGDLVVTAEAEDDSYARVSAGIQVTGNYQNTSEVNLISKNGNILINQLENASAYDSIKDIADEMKHFQYGIQGNMGAYVTLDAGQNNQVIGSTGISTNGASTTPEGGPEPGSSTVILSAGNRNDIYVLQDGINAHGGLVELNGKVNNITVYGAYGNMFLTHGIMAQSQGYIKIGKEDDAAETTNITVINDQTGAVTTNGLDLVSSTAEINSKNINITVQDESPSMNAYGISGNSSRVDFTGDAINVNVESDSGNSLGINGLTSQIYLNADSYNVVSSGAYGIVSRDSTVMLNAEADGNYVTARNYGIWGRTQWGDTYSKENTVSLTGANNVVTATADTAIGIYADKAVQAGMTASYTTKIELTADSRNFINAGMLAEDSRFRKGTAIKALSGSDVFLQTENGINLLTGSIYAAGSDETVSNEKKTQVKLDGKYNSVYSAAVISGAGDLDTDKEFAGKDIISALYAEDNASITADGDLNIFRTYADDPTSTNTLERTIWAYNKADITVNGGTYISTDRYKETSAAQPGNSADIAIAAGTAVGLDDGTVNAPVADRAVVTVNYDDYTVEGQTYQSSITGDILAAYAGQVDINAKDGSEAGISVTGNILAGNNGVLNLDLGKGGVLTGRADDYGDAGLNTTDEDIDQGHATHEFFNPAFSSTIFKGGEVNLSMGEGSRWNVTGQSWVTRINTESAALADEVLAAENPVEAMNHMATIDLVDANTDRNTNAHALTVYEMTGDAVFNMSLDADRDVSDMLYMKSANGDYIINVVDAVTLDDMYAEGFDGLRFATVGEGSNVSFRAVTVGQGVFNVEYEVGTDAYANNDENHAYNGGESVSEDKPGSDLVDGFFESTQEPGAAETQAAGKRMRMAAMAMHAAANDGIMLLDDTAAADDTAAVDGSVDETTNFKLIGRKGESTSNAGKTIIDMSKVNYSNAVYMDRLNKRMGEARYIDGDEGLWVRMRHDRIGKSDAFRSKNTMFELGYDRKVGDREDGEHRQGVVFDYMRGTADYHNVAGEGDVRRGGVWFYDTWLGNKGHYTDYVLKFGRLSNDFDIYSELGEKITGDYSNFVYSASAEYGRKKSLGGDWYIEPQAQLQYAHVTDADYTTSQDTSVQLDAIDSLIGRVGFRLGKDVSDTSTFYIKADVLHEFLGDQDISAFDATGRLDTTYENEGTWYDVGLGFSHQFSKGTYMFLDVEKTFGNDNEDTYQFNVGMNWKV